MVDAPKKGKPGRPKGFRVPIPPILVHMVNRKVNPSQGQISAETLARKGTKGFSAATVRRIQEGKVVTSAKMRGVCERLGISMPSDAEMLNWLSLGMALHFSLPPDRMSALITKLTKMVEGREIEEDLAASMLPPSKPRTTQEPQTLAEAVALEARPDPLSRRG